MSDDRPKTVNLYTVVKIDIHDWGVPKAGHRCALSGGWELVSERKHSFRTRCLTCGRVIENVFGYVPIPRRPAETNG